MEKTKHSCIGVGWKLVVNLRNLGLVLKPFETLAKWSAALGALTWNGLLTMPAGLKQKKGWCFPSELVFVLFFMQGSYQLAD